MALIKTFETDIGVSGEIAKILKFTYLEESSTVQVRVGVYLDEAHMEQPGSKPFWMVPNIFDCLFDPESNTPMIQQIEEDLIARFDWFAGATRG